MALRGAGAGSVAQAFQRQVQAMAVYLSLIQWEEQGVRNVKDTVERAGAFRADVERRGGKLLSLYWIQGKCDIIATIEAPDAETALAALLAVSSVGNVPTQTLAAFSERAMASIIQKV